ncbi:SDR family NAD(P)-dependent oxidoreductase [Kribbia dieselivorans]|uniref:SDR family NAD(P)-dependent oxidoreductase n=1 Tax=Kribbia dieselivorans TaxID=331526 RepID=UPI0008390735|nr:SDR family NAD(P)-dependent oxidoreductase [Kribbia dieselivorans]
MSDSATVTPTGRLAGRTALITGATRGIGLAIAREYARQGADLMLAATNEVRLDEVAAELAQFGTRIETAALDVADRDSCFAVAAKARERLGPVDVLINNAGVYIAKPFLEYTFAEYDRVQQVNLNGVFHLMQAVLPDMVQRGYGKVVNIASTAGKWGSRNQSAYNVAKHGVVGMTRCVALEMAPHGITVNAICPGLVQTDLLDGFQDVHAGLGSTTPQTVHDDLVSRVPIRRFLDPTECGHLAVYLGSAESDGMTGQSILLDGGMLMI